MTRLLLIVLLLFLIFPHFVFAEISFKISNPNQSGEEISIDVSLLGLTSSSCPNNSCYLQGAFKSQTKTRYFGYTKNNSGQWYQYNGSPDKEFIKNTFFSFQPQEGNWNGKMNVKIDPESPEYNGPGSYEFKVLRYTGNSSSAAGDSDTVTINVAGPTLAPTPTDTPIPIATPTPTRIPSPTKTPTPTKTPIPTKTPTSTKIPSSGSNSSNTQTQTTSTNIQNTPTVVQTGKVLGEKENEATKEAALASTTPNPFLVEATLGSKETTNTKKSGNIKMIFFLPILGGLIFIAGGALIFYRKHRGIINQ